METNEPPQLIAPAPDATSFSIGGVAYTATDDLSIARYRVFQKRSIEFGYDATFKGVCNSLDEAWANLNENKLGRAAQVIGNLRDGISRAGENRVMGIELASLFFNAPDEDPLTYDHPKMLAKMEAWEKGGLSAGWLFLQAARRVSGFYERFLPSPE